MDVSSREERVSAWWWAAIAVLLLLLVVGVAQYVGLAAAPAELEKRAPGREGLLNLPRQAPIAAAALLMRHSPDPYRPASPAQAPPRHPAGFLRRMP